MRVVLAGYNVDRAVIDELKKNSPPREDVTPETLSASYARISRDPRPADELRAAARVEVDRARRSNRTIIFKMGHHSVAEHAVFNFDIIGVSRLAIEEIERFRLCSFTEKSQRYITLGNDYVVPAEITRAGKAGVFVATVKAQNALYHRLLKRLVPYFLDTYGAEAAIPGNRTILEGWAKEDARYAVSLATEGQLGMTVNARNLELLIRRFAGRPNEEIRDLNRRLAALAAEVAPSIILFTAASAFDTEAARDIADAASDLKVDGRAKPHRRSLHGAVEHPVAALAGFTPDGDSRILAALLHTISNQDYGCCLRNVRRMPPAGRRRLARSALGRMEFYDFPPREFEYAGFVFDLVVSASCFAQLKRHRMATMTCQRYDPSLGVTVPPSVEAVGAGPEFRSLIGRTNETHARLRAAAGPAADYVLTNAHRRRVLFGVNVRELYHLSRLREDATAQWEIRGLAAGMARAARRRMPLACMLLGGKDAYPGVYKKVFGRAPRLTPPKLFA